VQNIKSTSKGSLLFAYYKLVRQKFAFNTYKYSDYLIAYLMFTQSVICLFSSLNTLSCSVYASSVLGVVFS